MLHKFLLKRTIKTFDNNNIPSKKRLENVKQSAISDLLLTCGFNINVNDFTILFEDSNNFNLLIKESLLIAHDKLILNKTFKFFPLELFE